MTAKKSATKNYIHRHKDGSIWAEGKLIKGRMDGHWKWFRKDGTKMRTGYFRKGEQTGKWTTYDKDGGIVKVTDFDK